MNAERQRIMRKINRKLIVFMLIICMIIGLNGCMKLESKDNEKLSVVTTIFASYDFAKQIAGDNAEVTMLLKPGAEAHTYEPTPKDIITIQQCDVFIYVGGENDEWVNDILDSLDTSKMKIVKLLDCVKLYEEEVIEGMEEEHGEHDEAEDETEWDEHVWTSPVNAVTICESLETVFSELDEDNSSEYKDNLKNYTQELKDLDEQFKEVVKNGKRNTIIFGDRFPLRYFVEEYGIEYFAAFPGCAAQSEASASTIAFLINKVKDNEIPVVFKIELSNGNIADSIASDSGAKVLTFNTCHNVTKENFDKGATYISLMKENVEVLKEALN